MATKTTTTPTTGADELHPDGAERPSEAAMREAAQHDAPPENPEPAAKPTRRRKAAAAKPAASSAKRVSGRDAVAKVLADGKPQKAKDITAAAVKLVRPKMTGKTPEATLGALLYTEAKKKGGLVVKAGAGRDTTFRLRPVKAAK